MIGTIHGLSCGVQFQQLVKEGYTNSMQNTEHAAEH